jgi:hypothetical protein
LALSKYTDRSERMHVSDVDTWELVATFVSTGALGAGDRTARKPIASPSAMTTAPTSRDPDLTMVSCRPWRAAVAVACVAVAIWAAKRSEPA